MGCIGLLSLSMPWLLHWSQGQKNRIRMVMQACRSRGSRLDWAVVAWIPFPSRAASVDTCERVLLVSVPLTPLLDHHWWRLNTCSLLEKIPFESWKKRIIEQIFCDANGGKFSSTSGVAAPALKIINCLIYWTYIILVYLAFNILCVCGFPTVMSIYTWS